MRQIHKRWWGPGLAAGMVLSCALASPALAASRFDAPQALKLFGQPSTNLVDCDIGKPCFVGGAVDVPAQTNQTGWYDLVAGADGLVNFQSFAAHVATDAEACPAQANGACFATGSFMIGSVVAEVPPLALMAMGLIALGLSRRTWWP